jgi:hypothetical protein
MDLIARVIVKWTYLPSSGNREVDLIARKRQKSNREMDLIAHLRKV